MKLFPGFITLLLAWIPAHAGEPQPFTAPAEPQRFTSPAPAYTAAIPGGDNEELARLARQDQEDRRGSIDWSVVIPRDQAREKRVKELYVSGALHTGTDYYNVAMVLQHGTSADDMLLAHDLCVVAIIKGENRAKWLAAASEDRFLMNIGRPQRFGTQYVSSGNGPSKLFRLEDGVTDDVRRAMNVPVIGNGAGK